MGLFGSLGTFRGLAIAGGAAADVIRPAEEKREARYNDAFDKFVDNNVPRFMEARQKRISIKNNLKGQLNNIVATYIRPTDLNISENSAYELAEKLLFDNGGKIENINTRYKNEMANSNDKNYTPATFINKYFNNPKDNKDSRTIDQILDSKANELAPDPTIDIAGKAESLAGYKDSAFYTMNRDTVKARLIAATGFTEPPVLKSNNLYDNNILGTTTADKFSMQDYIANEQAIKIQKNNIYTTNENIKIGQYGAGKVGTEFKKLAETALKGKGVALNYDNAGDWKILAGRPKSIHEAYLDSFSGITKTLFNNKSIETSKAGLVSTAKNALPDLTAIANVTVAEKLTTQMGVRRIISQLPEVPASDDSANTESYDTGKVDVFKTKPFRLYQRYRNVNKGNKIISVPYGDKFMFTATIKLENSNRYIIDVNSKHVFK